MFWAARSIYAFSIGTVKSIHKNSIVKLRVRAKFYACALHIVHVLEKLCARSSKGTILDRILDFKE